MIKNDTSTSDKSVLGSDILTVAFESESLHSYLDKEVRKFSINVAVQTRDWCTRVYTSVNACFH